MRPILLLAAGASSRMGPRDKLLEEVAGQPLIRTLADRALSVSGDVYVALRPDRPERRAALEGLPLTPLVVPEAAEGMAGTMRGAVARLPRADFMMLLGDLPDITAADMTALWRARAAHPDHLIWRGATRAGKPGHPILFHARLIPRFAELSGDTGGESLVTPLRAQTYLHPLGDRARRDLDTPEDWATWRARQS